MRKRIAIAVGAVALGGFIIPINKSLLESPRVVTSDIQTSLIMGGSRVQALSASSQISALNPVALVKGLSGAVAMTSTPTIADGTDGQLIMLFGMDGTNTVTVQDQGTLASSNLELAATTRTLGQGDILMLMYHNGGNPRSVPAVETSNWYEVSFSNNWSGSQTLDLTQ